MTNYVTDLGFKLGAILESTSEPRSLVPRNPDERTSQTHRPLSSAWPPCSPSSLTWTAATVIRQAGGRVDGHTDGSSSLQCPEPVACFSSTPHQPLGSSDAPHSLPPQGLYIHCSLCLEWSSSGYLANSKSSSGNEQMPSKNLLLTPNLTEPPLIISGSLFSTPSEHKHGL